MSVNDLYYCCFVNISQEKIINIPKHDELPSITTHYSAFECGATFSSEDDLRGHLEKEHRCEERTEYECGVCEIIYNTQEACVKHYEECHMDIKQKLDYDEQSNGESSIEITYVEPSNIEVSENLPEYSEEVYVKTELANKKLVKQKPKLTFICDICHKTYTSKTILRYHMNIHIGVRPYKCNMCTKSFTNPTFLLTHHRTHTGERPYKCPICPKAFGNQAALWRHDRVHTGKRPYECKMCSKTFTQSNSLKLHINTVHFKMPAPYKKRRKQASNTVEVGNYHRIIPITWP